MVVERGKREEGEDVLDEVGSNCFWKNRERLNRFGESCCRRRDD